VVVGVGCDYGGVGGVGDEAAVVTGVQHEPEAAGVLVVEEGVEGEGLVVVDDEGAAAEGGDGFVPEVEAAGEGGRGDGAGVGEAEGAGDAVEGEGGEFGLGAVDADLLEANGEDDAGVEEVVVVLLVPAVFVEVSEVEAEFGAEGLLEAGLVEVLAFGADADGLGAEGGLDGGGGEAGGGGGAAEEEVFVGRSLKGAVVGGAEDGVGGLEMVGGTEAGLPLALADEEGVVVEAEAEGEAPGAPGEGVLDEGGGEAAAAGGVEAEVGAAAAEVVGGEVGVVVLGAGRVEGGGDDGEGEGFAEGEGLVVGAGAEGVVAEDAAVAGAGVDGGEAAGLAGGDGGIAGTGGEGRFGGAEGEVGVEGGFGAKGADPAEGGGEVAEELALVLAGGVLGAEVGELEGGAAGHGGEAEDVVGAFGEVEAKEGALGVAAVVEVVERDLIEVAVGLEVAEGEAVAEGAALAGELEEGAVHVEAAGLPLEVAGGAAAGTEAGAGGDVGDGRDLAAELGGDVAGEEFDGLGEVGVNGVGEGTGHLVGDGHAVDDISHLVVGTAGVDGAVGVLGEAREGDEDGFHAAAAEAGGHAVNFALIHLGMGAGFFGIDEAGSAAVDGHGGGEGPEFEGDGEIDGDVGAEGDLFGPGLEALALDDEAIGVEGDVGEGEGAGFGGDGGAMEAGDGVLEADGGCGDGAAVRVEDAAGEGGRRLGEDQGREEGEEYSSSAPHSAPNEKAISTAVFDRCRRRAGGCGIERDLMWGDGGCLAGGRRRARMGPGVQFCAAAGNEQKGNGIC